MSVLKDKIDYIIKGLGLTPMRFADIIGVKRPIISHILSGRNKPSLDIVQKIIDRFPKLQYDWIGDSNTLDLKILQEIKEENDFSLHYHSARETDENDEVAEEAESANSGKESEPRKKLDKIIFFYDDGTFKVYLPESMGL